MPRRGDLRSSERGLLQSGGTEWHELQRRQCVHADRRLHGGRLHRLQSGNLHSKRPMPRCRNVRSHNRRVLESDQAGRSRATRVGLKSPDGNASLPSWCCPIQRTCLHVRRLCRRRVRWAGDRQRRGVRSRARHMEPARVHANGARMAGCRHHRRHRVRRRWKHRRWCSSWLVDCRGLRPSARHLEIEGADVARAGCAGGRRNRGQALRGRWALLRRLRDTDGARLPRGLRPGQRRVDSPRARADGALRAGIRRHQ